MPIDCIPYVKKKRFYLKIKRSLDVIISLIALIALSPLFLIIATAIAIDTGRPVFFSQRCAGYLRRTFTIYKFRTMPSHFSPILIPIDKKTGIPENYFFQDKKKVKFYTKLSNFLRQWHLDGLPQLYNVLKGQMSLVGPKPELIELAYHYNLEQCQRLKVKPGLTGLAQINNYSELSFKEKIQFDLDYVDQFSFLMDSKILLLTLIRVCLPKIKIIKNSTNI